MVAAGQFGHHAAIGLVHVDLAVQRLRAQHRQAGAARLDQRDTGFVAGGFDTQDKHRPSLGEAARHGGRRVIWRDSCAPSHDALPVPSPRRHRTGFALSGRGDDHAVEQAERSRLLRISLLENGYNIIAVLPTDTFLGERIAQLQPDMIVVDAESAARDALEHVVMATRDARRPIVLFTNDEDTTHVKDAVAAGVSAYIVAGLAPDRIRPILDVAMARFQHEQQLRRELADARSELQERKVIDRAKGLLMQRQGLTESEAYEKLRKTAMDRGLKLGDVAQRILDVADLLA